MTQGTEYIAALCRRQFYTQAHEFHEWIMVQLKELSPDVRALVLSSISAHVGGAVFYTAAENLCERYARECCNEFSRKLEAGEFD